MSGVGSIFSYMVHHHPPMPGFQTPHPVAVIALDEGIRFVAAMDGTAPEALKIGLPVQAEFFRRDAVATVRFKLA